MYLVVEGYQVLVSDQRAWIIELLVLAVVSKCTLPSGWWNLFKACETMWPQV